MKKLFLFSLLLLSTQLVAQNFDDLVSRTMNGKLTPYDFDNSNDYSIVIDTIGNHVNISYINFKNSVNVTNEVNRLGRFLKESKIINTEVYDNSIPNRVSSRLSRHNRNYLVQWWFENDGNKLSAVTIVKR